MADGTKSSVQQEPVPLGIGKTESLGPNPVVGLILAVLVGALVFGLMWKVRKTFGMKD
jgi:hypothetical protein